MSPDDPVTPERLERFLARLARDYREPGSVYLVGGTGLLYQQLKGLTKDVDLATRMPVLAPVVIRPPPPWMTTGASTRGAPA